MENHLILSFALIGIIGVGAQWFAWRLNLPAIVLMSLAGLLVGPVLGWIHPEEAFGEFYRPIIAVAVAIILFEGGLSLKFEEIKGTVGSAVLRLVLVGVPIAWLLGALAAYYLAGLSVTVSVLFAGIMVVTGPTVIMPLLRQARLSQKPGALLKWEGIINDPIGAVLAVGVYEWVTLRNYGITGFEAVGSVALGTILAVVWGIVLGRMIVIAFIRGWVPEYLKPPVLLTLVLVGFETANLLQEEAGLLAVTAMGVTIANSKLPSINQIRHFKENSAVLFVSGVFVILTANLSWETISAALNWSTLAFVVAMIFIVRPATILLSLLGTDLKMRERLLVAWIAPRGIVAVAVSGFFAGILVELGFEDAGRIIPLAFAMVFATVVLHGFSITPLAKLLGLASSAKPGFLVVGSSAWSVALAKKLMELEIPVVVADDSWRALRPARQAGVPTYYGEILSEVTEHHLDLNQFGFLLAVGGNEAHNSLVCTDLAPEMGRATIFQISTRAKEENERRSVSYALQGRTLLASRTGLDELLRRQYAGWLFHVTQLSEEYKPDQYAKDIGEGEPVMIIRKDVIHIASGDKPLRPEIGDTVMAYVPPEAMQIRGEMPPGETRDDADDLTGEIRQRKEEALSHLPEPGSETAGS